MLPSVCIEDCDVIINYCISQPQPDGGKKGKAGRGKAHPPPSAEYSQLDTTSRSTEGSTAQVRVYHSLPPSLLTSCSCVVPPGGGGVCRAKHRSSLRSTDQSVITVRRSPCFLYL